MSDAENKEKFASARDADNKENVKRAFGC